MVASFFSRSSLLVLGDHAHTPKCQLLEMSVGSVSISICAGITAVFAVESRLLVTNLHPINTKEKAWPRPRPLKGGELVRVKLESCDYTPGDEESTMLRILSAG